LKTPVSNVFDTVLFGFLLLLPISLAIYGGMHPPQSAHPADFAIYRTAAQIVRSGQGANLYDLQTQKSFFAHVIPSQYSVFLVWNHHPAEAILYLPATLFPYETGLRITRLISISMMCLLIIWAVSRLRTDSGKLFLLWIVLMVGIRSFVGAIQAGQDSIWVLFLIVIALVRAYENKHLSSGILLGLASIKFTIVLPLLAILLLARITKSVLYCLLTAISLIILTVAILGVGILPSYLALCTSLINMNGQLGMYPALLLNFRGIIMRFLPTFGHTIMISGVFGALYAMIVRKIPKRYVMPAALLGGAFFSPHVYLHDTVMYVGAAILALIASQRPDLSRSVSG
jgi:hypothetical protein